MSAASDKNSELTRTIQIGQLRSVADPLQELLSRATDEERSILAELSDDAAMLISLSGPSRGARFLIDSDETRIGRATDNEIFLDDVTVSRHHAVIKRSGKSYTIEDLASLNGTYVDGTSISAAALRSGVEVQIGKFRMHFFSGSTNGRSDQ